MLSQIVLAAAACTATAQVYAPGLAIPAAAPSHQFHAQDEFGQFSFGHAGGPSARTEARNAYGVTTGSYQYIDANGLIQTVNYIADDVNGFRVQGTNLPVAGSAGLVAPVFEGVQAPAPVFEGVQIGDTQEVIDAKAAFASAYAAQEAAVAAAAPAERKRRSAQVVAAGLPLAGLGAYAGLPLAGAYAGLPLAGAYAGLPLAGAYAGLPLAGAYAGHPLAGAYAHGLVAPIAAAEPATIVADIAHATPEVVGPAAFTYAAGAFPVAAAAPSREAVLTTIKLNPGHAVFYRVD